MNYILKNDIIKDITVILDEMAECIRNIIIYENEYDFDSYDNELKHYLMFLKKEKMILYAIPKNIDVINQILDNFKNNFGSYLKNHNNYDYVLSRFVANISNIIRNMSIEEQYDNLDELDIEEIKEEQKFNNLEHAIRINLMAEYVKSFKNAYLVSDDLLVNYTFRNIQYYNIFINPSLCELFISSGFNFDNINTYSDHDLIKMFKIDTNIYNDIKDDVIKADIDSFLNILFNISSKNHLNVLDLVLNFRFLIKKVSLEDLVILKDSILDEINNSADGFDLYKDIFDVVTDELSLRNYVPKEENNDFIDNNIFERIVSLVKVEEKIFDSFYSNNVNNLLELLKIEKDLSENIIINGNDIVLINSFINDDLWIFLKNNDEKKVNLITQRIYSILPFFKDLSVPTSQNVSSYKSIYINFLKNNLRTFYDISLNISNTKIKNIFNSIYKDYIFTSPELTYEFALMNGNDLLISPLSDDIVKEESKINDIEYFYDKQNQLYNLSVKSIDYLIDNEYDIDTIYDYANYQFQLVCFVNAVNELDIDKLIGLKRYIQKHSSIFSSVRRDTINIIKKGISNISLSKTLKIIKIDNL